VHLSRRGSIIQLHTYLVESTFFCKTLSASLGGVLGEVLLVMLRLCLFLEGLVFVFRVVVVFSSFALIWF
jgi:hypothetical protein